MQAITNNGARFSRGVLGKEILVLASLALVLCLAAVSWAGEGGSISGTVKDTSDAMVPKVTVIATSTDTGIRQTVATDSQGFYSFSSLPIGHYDLEFQS